MKRAKDPFMERREALDALERAHQTHPDCRGLGSLIIKHHERRFKRADANWHGSEEPPGHEIPVAADAEGGICEIVESDGTHSREHFHKKPPVPVEPPISER